MHAGHMAQILKPCNSEHFMVDIFEVTEADVNRVRLRDACRGTGEYIGFAAGKYARLSHRDPTTGARGVTIMSDTWMEEVTNSTFIRKAKGDVLLTGLGIGMCLLDIQDKPEVTSVTVVEKEQEVIDLYNRMGDDLGPKNLQSADQTLEAMKQFLRVGEREETMVIRRRQ